MEYIYSRSFIYSYYDGPFALYAHGAYESFNLSFIGVPGNVIYYCPESGHEGESVVKFLEIAERNGDRSYNRREWKMAAQDRRACADNFKSVRIVCLRGDWDEDHPQGSLLNDLAKIRYWTYAEYIRNGYTGSMMEEIRKPVSELSEDDLVIVSDNFQISLAPYPSHGEYELEVTFVTTDGDEETATCTYDFGK